MPLKITNTGNFSSTRKYLEKMLSAEAFASLERFGQQGVEALARATPVESGLAASSWSYEIVQRSGYFAIHWSNSDSVGGVPLVILLTYGHGTRQGGYVHGRDFIMPAIRPVFDQMEEEMGKVVRG